MKINFTLIIEGLKDGLSTHPEGLKLFRLNKQDKNKGNGRGGEQVDKCIHDKETWGPFKPIPNVRKFKVELSVKDELMAKFGIKSKFSPKFKYETYENSDMNSYAHNQLYRLRIMAKEDPKLYGKTVNNLLRYSKVFFIMALNHVDSRGHREKPLGTILRLGRQYSKIAQKKRGDVEHVRLYIPKPNGKQRPLGVPGLVGRIYLHNIANFLSLYLEAREWFSPNQHGFRTNKGTGTAWKQVFKDVIEKADGIYEFDLERCFSNLSVNAVSKVLRINKVPEGGISKFKYLNMVPVGNPMTLKFDQKEANEYNKYLMKEYGFTEEMLVKNPNIEKFPESEYVKVEGDLDEDLKLDLIFHNYNLALNGTAPKEENSSAFISGFKVDNLKRVFNSPFERDFVSKGTSSDNLQTNGINLMKVIGSEENQEFKSEAKGSRGLPQGLPTSPLLTVMTLEHYLIKPCKFGVLMYADDGIFYGNGPAPTEEEILKDCEEAGIIFSREKSRGVKKDGIDNGFKFLGMRFRDGEGSAETRKGAKIKFDQERMNLVVVRDILDNLDEDQGDVYVDSFGGKGKERIRDATSGEILLRSKIFGLIQSRMYQDSGRSEDVSQCFDLTKKSGSGMDRRAEHGMELTVFNSTSFACNDILTLLESQKHSGRGRQKP